MYSYDLEAADAAGLPRHQCYRPDLLPVITRWLSYVPESEWQYFVGFRVGQRGEFIAKFMKAPTGSDVLRLVTFTVDHNRSEMRTDTGVWGNRTPVQPTTANITMAVNTL